MKSGKKPQFGPEIIFVSETENHLVPIVAFLVGAIPTDHSERAMRITCLMFSRIIFGWKMKSRNV